MTQLLRRSTDTKTNSATFQSSKPHLHSTNVAIDCITCIFVYSAQPQHTMGKVRVSTSGRTQKWNPNQSTDSSDLVAEGLYRFLWIWQMTTKFRRNVAKSIGTEKSIASDSHHITTPRYPSQWRNANVAENENHKNLNQPKNVCIFHDHIKPYSSIKMHDLWAPIFNSFWCEFCTPFQLATKWQANLRASQSCSKCI